MQYKGKLYGKVGREYIPLVMNSDEVDELVKDKERLDFIEQTIMGTGKSKFLVSVFMTHYQFGEGICLDWKSGQVVHSMNLRAAIDSSMERI